MSTFKPADDFYDRMGVSLASFERCPLPALLALHAFPFPSPGAGPPYLCVRLLYFFHLRGVEARRLQDLMA